MITRIPVGRDASSSRSVSSATQAPSRTCGRRCTPSPTRSGLGENIGDVSILPSRKHPFIWTKRAEMIIAKIEHNRKPISTTRH